MTEQNRPGKFIKARRDLLRPADVGLAGPRSRRTSGLRREDLATLVGISVDYLSRLEQGRERNPSHRVIKALAEVLHLDVEATEHLHRLAHPQQIVDGFLSEEVNPDLSRMLAAWPDTPAMVVGSGLDILTANPLAAALYSPAGPQPNLLLFTFLDPQAREFFVDWEIVAGGPSPACMRSPPLRTMRRRDGMRSLPGFVTRASTSRGCGPSTRYASRSTR